MRADSSGRGAIGKRLFLYVKPRGKWGNLLEGNVSSTVTPQGVRSASRSSALSCPIPALLSLVFNSNCSHLLLPAHVPLLLSLLAAVFLLFFLHSHSFVQKGSSQKEKRCVASYWERTKGKELPILKSLSLSIAMFCACPYQIFKRYTNINNT